MDNYNVMLQEYSTNEILSYILIQKMDGSYDIEDIVRFFGLDRKMIIKMATKVLHKVIKEEKYELKIK